jgi:calreticulin
MGFDASYTDRWVVSQWKDSSEIGKWKLSAGKAHGDKDDKGLQTGEDARFYGLSAEMPVELSNKDKDLVIQFSVKHDQKIDCGGGYIKLMQDGLDQANFGGDSKYAIMFGPDICGYSNRKTHVILHYEPKGENLQIKKEVRCETDELTHLYTLILHPDNTFEVKIDGKKVESGNLEDNFDMLEPKQIQDPEESKPEDWVDEAQMVDPEDVKPEGHDDIPEEIPDPDAEKPDDWDDEDDGEWEPPMISNPEYKGEWKPKMIANPEYKGEWVHPMIDNPDYSQDDDMHAVCNPCKFVGFELWQVKAGTIFDDIIVTDSEEEAAEFAAETFDIKIVGEKKMHEKQEAAQKKKDEEAAEAAKAEREEEEAKKKEEEGAGDEDEEDEEDEEDKDEL